MTLDGLMFDHVRSSPVLVMELCVRVKASVCPRISDDVVMHVVVKGGVFEFIGLVVTKNGVVLCVSIQDYFDFFAMYKTRMPYSNIMKKFRWEVIKLCEILEEQDLLVRKLGSFRVGGWCSARNVGRPGA